MDSTPRPKPKPACQGSPCGGPVFRTGQSLQEITCPCGYGYWDNIKHKFITGDLVRQGKAPTRAQYEAHVKQCPKQEKGAPVLAVAEIGGDTKTIWLGSTGDSSKSTGGVRSYPSREAEKSDARATTERHGRSYTTSEGIEPVTSGPRRDRHPRPQHREESESQPVPDIFYEFVKSVPRKRFDKCERYVNEHRMELLVPSHSEGCLLVAAEALRKQDKALALDWIEKAIIIEDLCKTQSSRERTTYFAKLDDEDRAATKRYVDLMNSRYARCVTLAGQSRTIRSHENRGDEDEDDDDDDNGREANYGRSRNNNNYEHSNVHPSRDHESSYYRPTSMPIRNSTTSGRHSQQDLAEEPGRSSDKPRRQRERVGVADAKYDAIGSQFQQQRHS